MGLRLRPDADAAHPELPAAGADARDSHSARCCRYRTERLVEPAPERRGEAEPTESVEDDRRQLLLHSLTPQWAWAQEELRVPAL
jgi:hypothetical protein